MTKTEPAGLRNQDGDHVEHHAQRTSALFAKESTSSSSRLLAGAEATETRGGLPRAGYAPTLEREPAANHPLGLRLDAAAESQTGARETQRELRICYAHPVPGHRHAMPACRAIEQTRRQPFLEAISDLLLCAIPAALINALAIFYSSTACRKILRNTTPNRGRPDVRLP